MSKTKYSNKNRFSVKIMKETYKSMRNTTEELTMGNSEHPKEKRNWSKVGKTLIAGGTAGCVAKTAMAPLDRVKILLQGHNKFYKNNGTAGCVAKTAVAPLDRVKILLQGHNKFYKNNGVIKSLRQVYTKEGYRGLLKGNYVQMIRVFPYAALQFFSYELYKKQLQEITHHDHRHIVHLVSGSMAGMTAVVATYPLDLMRARIAFQVNGEDIYFGVKSTVHTIIRDEGVFALYRGITATLLGMVPYGGISFYTFETTKAYLLEQFPQIFGTHNPNSSGGLVLALPAKLLCGSIAGAVAQSVVYPLDVTRRKIQLSTMLCNPEKYTGKSWYEILGTVYQDHGVRKGLYRGISINYMRVVPMTAISFTVFESMKQLLGLDTSVSR